MPPGGPGVFLETTQTVPIPPGGPGVLRETVHTVPMPPGGPGVFLATMQTVPIPPGGPGVLRGSTVRVEAAGMILIGWKECGCRRRRVSLMRREEEEEAKAGGLLSEPRHRATISASVLSHNTKGLQQQKTGSWLKQKAYTDKRRRSSFCVAVDQDSGV